MTTTIYSLPQNFIRSASWAQSDQRRNLQRSEFTGRTRETIIGPADRWTCAADIRPMRAGDIETWRAFQAQMKLPGARCRLNAVEVPQAGTNLVQNSSLGADSAFWLTDGGFVRQAAAVIDGYAPSDWAFWTAASVSNPALFANNGLQQVATPGQRFFLGAWVQMTGATGNFWLFAQWFNGATPLTPTLVATGVSGGWRRVTGIATAPSGATGVQFGVQNSLSAGSAQVAIFRASFFPERATVNGVNQTGETLALSGLAPSQRNLRAGQMLTVVLPGDDEQLIMLTADLLADASGNGTAQLGSPLRRSPANGATVELDRPWGLMRTTDPLGWTVDPAPIYGARQIIFEEAF
jgi:hypothetical protein